jgi:hypothetical protein
MPFLDRLSGAAIMALISALVAAGALGLLALWYSRRPPAMAHQAPSAPAGSAWQNEEGEAASSQPAVGQRRVSPVRLINPKAMARTSFTSTSALVLILIVTLGSIGVVNGLWSKSLTLEATVESGDINTDWIEITTSDQSAVLNTATISTVSLPGCEATIGGDPEFGDQVGNVVITDAVPAYWCEIEASVRNTGSVPFNIIGINAILDAANDEGLSFEDLNGIEPGVCQLIDDLGATTTEPVDPSEEAIVHCKVVVDPGAIPGWTYYFAVGVCVAQWNEDPSPGDQTADFEACKHPSTGTHEGPDEPALPAPGPTE